MSDVHMELLPWLADREGAPLSPAAETHGLPLADVERLVMELVEAGMLERSRVQ